MTDETKVVVENGEVTAAAAASASVAAGAADSAVKTATELAADQARVLSEETRLYREGIANQLGEFRTGIDKWQTENAAVLTSSLSAVTERQNQLETQIQETRAATVAALEELKTRLIPPKQEGTQQQGNLPAEPTRTELPQKSAEENRAAEQAKKRKIRRI